ncbi:uncharacterized protein LOC119069814 isoform X2 [Bradysia coprophila]|uniref:uncharacterized protein LOC119069814 isoform X2 n=1 Tax=Bradysia coprophila TaxID=38358 RepID=UPI00187DD132|nr:uncharacterized protein LOC119069814 isoform X2 [Bradysia coprophila]
MKFIFIVIALSALSALGSSYVDPVYLVLNTTYISDTYYSPDTFGNLQKATFITLATKLVTRWLKCNQTFPVPYNEGRGIFRYDVWSDKHNVNQQVKCFVDCMLREARVILDNDGSLDVVEYTSQIKQLRFNYTIFDINNLSMGDKQQIWDTVYSQANDYPRNCYAVDSFGNEFYDHSKFGSIKDHVSPTKVNIADNCYNLILSYAQAARKCKNVKDPNGNRCETSWMIMRCIMKENRERSFLGPFYPIDLKDE